AVARQLVVAEQVELVLRRRLPCQPSQVRVVPLPASAVRVERAVEPGRQAHDFQIGPRRAQQLTLRFVPVDAGELARHSPGPRQFAGVYWNKTQGELLSPPGADLE